MNLSGLPGFVSNPLKKQLLLTLAVRLAMRNIENYITAETRMTEKSIPRTAKNLTFTFLQVFDSTLALSDKGKHCDYFLLQAFKVYEGASIKGLAFFWLKECVDRNVPVLRNFPLSKTTISVTLVVLQRTVFNLFSEDQLFQNLENILDSKRFAILLLEQNLLKLWLAV